MWRFGTLVIKALIFEMNIYSMFGSLDLVAFCRISLHNAFGY